MVASGVVVVVEFSWISPCGGVWGLCGGGGASIPRVGGVGGGGGGGWLPF